jgi:tetratricopeptide (TPR) repeat protein
VALSGTVAAIDRYADSWVAMQEDSCRATRLRGDQSAELLDLRAECLDARRGELAALVGVLAKADEKTVLRAVEATSRLPNLAECANTTALKARVRPPADAATRAQVDAIRQRIDEGLALSDAAKNDAALPIVEAAAGDAKGLGYAPLQAVASYTLGLVRFRLGKGKLAEQDYKEAVYAAERSDDVEMTARAWVALAQNIGRELGREDEGHDCEQHAIAAIDKWGKGSDDARLSLMSYQGMTLLDHGKFEEAAALFQREATFAEGAVGPESRQVALAMTDLGIAQMRLAKYDDAIKSYDRAQAIREKLYGPSHPEMTLVLENMSTLYALQGLPAKAVVYDEKVARLDEAALGPDHPQLGLDLGNLCSTHIELGENERALGECQRALAIYEQALGPKHRRVTFPLLGLGQAYLNLGRPKDALPPLERALAIRTETGGDPVDMAGLRFTVARALGASGGDMKRARELAVSARGAFEKNGEQSKADLQRVDEWLAANK